MRYMRLLTITSLVCAMCVLLVPNVFASISTGDLVPNVVNHLEDNDFEGGLLLANGITLEIGDSLFGMFRVQSLNVPPFGAPIASDPVGVGTTFAGVFATTVLSKSGVGPFSWTFGPAPGGAGSIWDVLLGYPTPAAGTMIAVFQDSSIPRITDGAPSTGSDGTPLWEFGFTGAGGTAAAGEFWSATAPLDDPLMVLPISPGSFSNALNNTADFAGTGFIPHDFNSFGALTDLQGIGGFFNNPASSDSSLTPLASDTDFFIVPAPEPFSVVIWGVLATVVGIGVYRRRN